MRLRYPPVAALLAFSGLAPYSLAAASPAIVGAQAAGRVAAHVAAAARRFAIPERWIYAVMQAESAGDPRAVSPKGAGGLMQIMPATWTTLRIRYGLGDDLYDPRDNIMAGAGYLRELHDRYGFPGFLAAYNAGPGRYDIYLATGRPLPLETVAYVNKLAPILRASEADRVALAASAPHDWTRAALFAPRFDRPAERALKAIDASSERRPFGAQADERPVARSVPPGLFVPLSGAAAR